MPRPALFRIAWGAATHAGRRRLVNEDSYGARPDLGLFVVADGMGGHAAGEVASRLAVEAIIDTVESASGDDVGRPGPDAQQLAGRLRGAFAQASLRLASAVASDQGLHGMATTACAMLIGTAGDAAIGHVGDSRVYRARRGQVQRLTDDHSWVEEQVRAGLLDRRAAERHPWRNVVTRALSASEPAAADVTTVRLEDGDRYLLCSDGLHGVLGEARLADLLDGPPADLAQFCDHLVEEANAAGGPDNVTLIVLAIHAH